MVKKIKLTEPLIVNGRAINEIVQQISWTATSKEAAITDEQYDEFVVRGGLPSKAGVLWWKTVQTCDNSKIEWTEVPAQGTSTKGLKAPAALLEILPKQDAASSAPHH